MQNYEPRGYTIALSSLTYAQKLQRIYADRAIPSEVVKLTEKTRRGCTYGVYVSSLYFANAKKLLENGSVGRYEIIEN